MAVLKSLQTGTVALTGASVTDTITSIDTTKSFLVFSVRYDETSPSLSLTNGQITNGTTLTFKRNGAGGTINIQWYVAEFESGVSVQRGSITLDSTQPDNVTITSVDLTKAFPIFSCLHQGGIYGADDFVRAKITTSTNLELENTFGGGTGPVVEWQVVEFAGASVQTGDLAFGAGDSSLTDTITSVDTTKSWLLFSYESASGTGADIGQKMMRGVITNGTTLTFDRDNTGQAVDITWYLIEFTDGTTVQKGSEDFTTAQTQQDVTITSVDTARSIASAGAISYSGGKTPHSAAGNPGVGTVTLELTTATNLQLTRALTGTSTADIGWFVVEFNGVVEPSFLPSAPHNKEVDMTVNLRAKAPTGATVGTSSAQVLAANTLRQGVVLVNDSANKIYLSVESAAVLNSGIFLPANGGKHEISGSNLTLQAINAIADTASSNLTIQESN